MECELGAQHDFVLSCFSREVLGFMVVKVSAPSLL